MIKINKSKFEIMLDEITAKYEAQGMSNFDARMKAVMSPEANDQVFIQNYNVGKILENEKNNDTNQ